MDRDRLQPLVTALQDWATSGDSETGVGLDVVVDELLRDDSTEMAAAVGSVLERAALRIVRDGGDASQLGPLRERVAGAHCESRTRHCTSDGPLNGAWERESLTRFVTGRVHRRNWPDSWTSISPRSAGRVESCPHRTSW